MISRKSVVLHFGVVAALLVLNFLIPAYHQTSLARVMVLSVFAMGYNIAFGYTGLLSLGHALFFAVGMYCAGLAVHFAIFPVWLALALAPVAGGVVALATGALALRTSGTAFMIVTLMLSQAGYLTILHFSGITGGDEGIALSPEARILGSLDLANDNTRYFAALILFSVALMGCLIVAGSTTGRILVAIRENPERTRMLGFNPVHHQILALFLSGIYAGAAGGAYAILFGYIGAGFASIQYSIIPLLYVLLGGAATVLGPFIGALLMFYVLDISSGITDAYLFIVGFTLVLLVLFAPGGVMGLVRNRYWPWLP